MLTKIENYSQFSHGTEDEVSPSSKYVLQQQHVGPQNLLYIQKSNIICI